MNEPFSVKFSITIVGLIQFTLGTAGKFHWKRLDAEYDFSLKSGKLKQAGIFTMVGLRGITVLLFPVLGPDSVIF